MHPENFITSFSSVGPPTMTFFGELVLLALVVAWALAHALQVEIREWCIHRWGDTAYFSGRFAWSLCWWAGNAQLLANLAADSPVLWTGNLRMATVMVTVFTVGLMSLLLIPGAPIGINAKMAHDRHAIKHQDSRPNVTGEAYVSSWCKLSSHPQLLQVMAISASMCLGPTRRVHLMFWIPQWLFIGVGITRQNKRMATDLRYDTYLAVTRLLPFQALFVGVVKWHRRDSVIFGVAIGLCTAITLVLTVFLPTLAGVVPSACCASGQEWAKTHDCHVVLMHFELLYVGILITAAELNNRVGIYLLPVGRGVVRGTRWVDLEGALDQWLVSHQGMSDSCTKRVR
eukprot:m.371371 g.371371  ORF g.371371 m.371371 type:complete len:343 (-) comp16683_c0_seq38:3577-4605(-)